MYSPSTANSSDQPGTTNSMKMRRVEQKYSVSASLADEICSWARQHMQVDQHCRQTPPTDGLDAHSYGLTTLYLDTPQWDLFYRQSDSISSKHRLRRYNNEKTVWLETKRKRRQIVRKRRTPICDSETKQLWQTETASDSFPTAMWQGHWFRDNLQRFDLRPAVIVRYIRHAFVAETSSNTARLTIDSHICAERASDYYLPTFSRQGCELLPHARIVELKFNDYLPPLFRKLLIEFGLSAGSFSKYRTAVAQLNIVP